MAAEAVGRAVGAGRVPGVPRQRTGTTAGRLTSPRFRVVWLTADGAGCEDATMDRASAIGCAQAAQHRSNAAGAGTAYEVLDGDGLSVWRGDVSSVGLHPRTADRFR